MQSQNNLITVNDGINLQMPLDMLYFEIGKKEMIIQTLKQKVAQLEEQLKEKKAETEDTNAN